MGTIYPQVAVASVVMPKIFCLLDKIVRGNRWDGFGNSPHPREVAAKAETRAETSVRVTQNQASVSCSFAGW